MTVGVLLMTHEAIGPALVTAAEHVMGKLPLSVTALEVPADADPEAMLVRSVACARKLDQGGGVLVLTDVFGATPCNVARRMDELGVTLRCVPGLNLPMLLRVLNYADSPLTELAELAASGGRNGIFVDKS